MIPSDELLTPAEAAIVAGVPIKEVYKVARERLPEGLVVRRNNQVFFRSAAAICIHIDHLLPKDVPVKIRKALYAKVKRDPRAAVLEHRSGLLSYVVDTKAAKHAVTSELAAYRRAMEVIVEDPEVQAGAATFKGTRILVHTIADLLKAGVSAEELKEDYPSLTDTMIVAAPVYIRSHPRRGRPKAPAWRSGAPVSSRSHGESAA